MERRRPVYLDSAEQIAAMLDAAAELDAQPGARTSGRRALVATLVGAGPRVTEACELLWRDVDLANGRIRIGRSKTSAGVREVTLLPFVRDDLAAHKAAARRAGPGDPVFVTAGGRPRTKDNVRQRVIDPVARRADELLAERDLQPLPAGVTPHKLRHTFASVLVAIGEDPASVMAQLGHAEPEVHAPRLRARHAPHAGRARTTASRRARNATGYVRCGRSRVQRICFVDQYARPTLEAAGGDDRRELVTFSDPPVVEVALTIQFAEPVTDDARTLGDFWPRIRDEYPGLQQQPALPRMQEDFGPPQPPRIELMTEAPVRFWFLTADSSRLVQVQPDRLSANWRKVQPDTPYPRYRQLREQFEGLLTTFVNAVNPQVEVVPDSCEVTYVNHVLATERGATAPRLSEVLTLVSDPPSGVLPDLEDTQLVERFRIKDERDGSPVGRLHINAAPAIRTTDQLPLQQLTLTARGRPLRPDVEGGLTFLDYGHDLIVRGFREITTPEMHNRWGLRGACGSGRRQLCAGATSISPMAASQSATPRPSG